MKPRQKSSLEILDIVRRRTPNATLFSPEYQQLKQELELQFEESLKQWEDEHCNSHKIRCYKDPSIHCASQLHNSLTIVVPQSYTMSFKRPSMAMTAYVVKQVTLSPSKLRMVEFINSAEEMLNAEWEIWSLSPGCKTRENITNARVFLSTLRASLENENAGFRSLLIAIVEVKSLKNLLTAFRCPRGASDEVKASTYGKRRKFKSALIEIVRLIRNIMIGEDERLLLEINNATHMDIGKFITDQEVELVQANENADAEDTSVTITTAPPPSGMYT